MRWLLATEISIGTMHRLDVLAFNNVRLGDAFLVCVCRWISSEIRRQSNEELSYCTLAGSRVIVISPVRYMVETCCGRRTRLPIALLQMV